MILPNSFVSWLLRLANADVMICRDKFYALKDRLLKRRAKLVGYDLQEITHECFGCDGTGWYRGYEQCNRCYGTGIYERFWVRLERWDFAGNIFHRPVDRRYIRPLEPVTIQGKVKHPRYGRASREAALWLALLFDRSLFWKLLTGTMSYGRYAYPLMLVQRAAWNVRLWWKKCQPTRCHWCNRRLWFVRDHKGCPNKIRLDEEIPF